MIGESLQPSALSPQPDGSPPVPPTHSRLFPGTYLVAIDLARPIDRKILIAGLEKIGLSRIQLDADSPLRPRLVARALETIAIRDTPILRWRSARRIMIDVDREADRRRLRSHALRRGASYEIAFIVRVKAIPKREDVVRALETWSRGDVETIVRLGGVDLPTRPGVALVRWIAVLRWGKADTVTLPDDPILVDDLVEIT